MLERLFSFLDIVVLEPQPHGGFRGVTQFPRWFLEYHPNAREPGATLHFDSPFFVDFSMRAAEFWNAGVEGLIESGSWTETDDLGKDWMLQATAVVLSQNRYMILVPAQVAMQEAQILLQKGREKTLKYRSVKTKQRSLRKVEQRYETLLTAVSDWIFIVDQASTILEVSSGREELFEEFKPRPGEQLANWVPSDLASQLLPQIQNVISSGRPQLWRYKTSADSLEILILATGQDEAMCILRKR
jgi:PAS domain-containing protein